MYILLFLIVVLLNYILYGMINEWYIKPYEELKLKYQKEIRELNLQIDDIKKWYDQIVNHRDKIIDNLKEQLLKTSKKTPKKVEKKEVKDKIVVKVKKEKKPTKKILEKFESKKS